MFFRRAPSIPSDAGRAFDRGALILATLCAGGINAMLAAIAFPLPLITQLATACFLIYLSLAGMVWAWRAVNFAAHAMIACTFCIFATLISQTGGVNSPAMVWMPILFIAALLLINLRWSMVWMGLIVGHNLLQFIATQQHWINGQVDERVLSAATAFWVRVNVLVFLMVALGLYEAMFRHTMHTLALRNADLASLQSARHKAQTHIDALILSLGQHLRAPVQKIAALQSLLPATLRTAGGASPQGVQKLAQQIGELVSHVLDIALYETGRLSLKPAAFCVQEAIADAVRGHADTRTEGTPMQLTQVRSQAQEPRWVFGDANRFTQVVRFALSEADRHAAGKTMQLLWDLHGPQLHIQIRLMANAVGDHTAASSTQAHDSDKPGAGPAPRARDWEQALCERLLALAGAKLSELRADDTGRGIDLHWPVQECDPPHAVKQEASTLRQKAWRFLLVDDQTQRLSALHAVLRQHWPQSLVEQAYSGESALLQVEFAPYDLVLVALHMESMDGLETVRRMRQHAKAEVQNIAVIGLCDKEFAHQRYRCKEAGMQWLALWPLQVEALSQLIALHLPQEES